MMQTLLKKYNAAHIPTFSTTFGVPKLDKMPFFLNKIPKRAMSIAAIIAWLEAQTLSIFNSVLVLFFFNCQG